MENVKTKNLYFHRLTQVCPIFRSDSLFCLGYRHVTIVCKNLHQCNHKIINKPVQARTTKQPLEKVNDTNFFKPTDMKK